MRRRIPTVAALLLWATPVMGQERVIRFGLTGDYPPYAERLPDGTLRGSDPVIAVQIARTMHARAEFVPTTWATLTDDLKNDRFDVAIGGLTVTPERAAVGTYSIPLADDGKRPLARCVDAARYRSIAQIDRSGTRVQINRGPAIAAFAKGWFHRATVTINPDEADLTRALLEKRTDVWITDGVVVDHMARRYRGRLCATTATPFTHQDKAWLIRRDPVLVAAINAGLKTALTDGSWFRALQAVP